MLGLVLSVLAGGFVLNWAMDALDGSGGNASSSDGEDAPPGSTEPVDNVPTEGPDILMVAANATGGFFGLAGNDTITVEAQTGDTLVSSIPLGPEFSTDDGSPDLVISGDAGDDVIRLSGGGYAVIGGIGNDRIELGTAQNVFVSAQDADTVVGGSGGSSVHVALRGMASYIGSDANEVVVNQSSGPVSMGAGNDFVIGLDGASSVSGGNGDDVLIGTVNPLAFTPSATDRFSYFVSLDPDTLDGGAGDDQIFASHGDVITTGTGADEVALFLDTEASHTGAVVTDFDRSEDQILIQYGFFGDGGPAAPAPLVGQITVTETAMGDTVITGSNGQVLATLRGVTGVTVGLQPSDAAPLTNLAGTPTPDADYDVLISRFFNTTS